MKKMVADKERGLTYVTKRKESAVHGTSAHKRRPLQFDFSEPSKRKEDERYGPSAQLPDI